MTQPTPFDVHVAQTDGRTIVKPAGELDAYSAPQLRKILDEVLDGSVQRVAVDLAAISFIDSTGLGVLVGAARRAKAQGAEVVLDSPSHSVHRVLQITGLSLSITIENAPEAQPGDEPLPGHETSTVGGAT